ncbi:hypothetical protein FRUB_05523 [Fimbriiglobus ruber]|uniref:Uncharacterized protein n=1 Tax=Fimbriiglobus ruber TaxID=1908690 RepID=A0A225DLW1_9BACT|nr:hypothetical protein FRUB_05523 [Fimbriiglobus ruber]
MAGDSGRGGVLGLCPKPRWRAVGPPDLPSCSRSVGRSQSGSAH